MQGRDAARAVVVDRPRFRCLPLPERRGQRSSVRSTERPTAVRTVGAGAALPPQHRRPECAFGRVVGPARRRARRRTSRGPGPARGCADRWPPSCGARRPPRAGRQLLRPVGGAAASPSGTAPARGSRRAPGAQAANIALVSARRARPSRWAVPPRSVKAVNSRCQCAPAQLRGARAARLVAHAPAIR